ncbi:LpqB family beta-propeller domain-containing protein [Kocuria sp.]|uniref:LpqB family beta-propeller domain-containing protein n=1 Tax=Kocuria sp. TaxID=1871328 RepID=UPI0026DFEE43|nr:LpqB family beta-propeller domain-containing protein [Kocuria sp.]MDO5619580.1 LpqB family beta-propeller domain-containing protein [Kocuria sp.]
MTGQRHLRGSEGGTGARWAGVVLTGALALTGCATIPNSGPVHQVEAPLATPSQPSAGPTVAGPEEDMSPEEIVRGFLAAGAGQENDYAVARQFLTNDLASTWRPYARTVVFSGAAGIQQGLEEDQVRVSVDARAMIDNNGIMQRQEAGSSEALDVELTQVDGQWRISNVPDGVLIPASNLDELYRAHNVYFLADDGETMIPDPRWFPDRPGVSTSLVRSLLGGPAPYLEGAVTSAYPGDTELEGASVPVQDGTATVSLNVPNYSALDVATNREMYSQLTLTLLALDNVDRVDLLAGGGQVDLGSSDQGLLSMEPREVPPRQIGLDGDQLVFQQGGQSSPVDGVADSLVGTDPSHPAMNTETNQFAALTGDGSALVTFSAAAPDPVERFTGSGLSAPSVDNDGWVFSGDDTGEVRATRIAQPDAEPVTVSADWLDGRAVASLKISRAGTRALMVVNDGDSSQVLISGVRRDADGTPRSLNEPYVIDSGQGAAMMGDAQWISESQFVAAAVTDRSTAPRLYDVSGRYRDLPFLEGGVSNVAGGNGETEIFVVSDGQLRMLTGESWSLQSDSVESTAFAG